MKTQNCKKCKKEVGTSVCEYYITYIHEDGESYECYQCFKEYYQQEYEKELHTRMILEKILSKIIGAKE